MVQQAAHRIMRWMAVGMRVTGCRRRGEALRNTLRWLLEQRDNPGISTGFAGLDDQLSGGLREGLYVIGAMSSLGKTAFCLQMANQIAHAGHHVLFLSLATAGTDLISRSLSYLTFLREQAAGRGSANAKTTIHFKTGECFVAGTNTLSEDAQAVMEDYFTNYLSHMHIASWNHAAKVSDIRKEIEDYTRQIGKTPVIFVDYLQLIHSNGPADTDKQNIDAVIADLKHMSAEFHTPIIDISSINRKSYASEITYGSFKESGCVEHFADVLIGMQYDGMDELAQETERERERQAAQIIEQMDYYARHGLYQTIKVTIIKDWGGHKGSCLMNFYPKYNYFEEPHAKVLGTDCTVPNDEWWYASRKKKKASTSK